MNHKLLLTTLVAAPLALTAAIPQQEAQFSGRDAVRTNQPTVTLQQTGKHKAVKQAPQRRSKTFVGSEIPEEIKALGELELLLEEDFSKVTEGSEDAPVDQDFQIKDSEPEYMYPWTDMRPKYTHVPGWGIGNAKAAGGCLAFQLDRMNPQGKINTPILDLQSEGGIAVLEFRARCSEPGKEHGIFIETAETNNWAPSWDIYDDAVSFAGFSTEWATVRMLVQGAGPTTLFNIVPQSNTPTTYFVDDVKVYKIKPHIIAPTPLPHTDYAQNDKYTDSSFTCNWTPVEGAESYLLNLYYLDGNAEPVYALKDYSTTETSYRAENLLDEDYYYTLRAVKGEHVSIESQPYLVYDIVTPRTPRAVLDPNGRDFVARWDEVPNAYGYNYFATARRVAEEDGEFLITDENFDDICLADGSHTGWTIENPSDLTMNEYYPIGCVSQEGWAGYSWAPYEGFLCLDAYHQSMGGNTSWQSPEFDLSKDGGKFKVRVKLAARHNIVQWQGEDEIHEYYAQCAVAIFNWNPETREYDQVALQYSDQRNGFEPVREEWKDYEFSFDCGTDRTLVCLFAVDSFDNLYVDDLQIAQNYKKGEYFDDPFMFRYFALVDDPDIMEDPLSWPVKVPQKYDLCEVYHKINSARAIWDTLGNYAGKIFSQYTEPVKARETNQAGIDGIQTEDNAEAVYYTISGLKVDGENLPAGVYVRVANGKAEKIVK